MARVSAKFCKVGCFFSCRYFVCV